MTGPTDHGSTATEPDGAGSADSDRAGIVAVCCLTFRRPVGLRRVLEGIAALRFDTGVTPESVRVVIVDNDPEGSGEAIVDEMRAEVPFELRYAVEARRGIPFGRNRAVAESGDVDLIAFLDDDEAPEPDWLAQLLHTAAETGADVVTGPVLPVFDERPPDWVLRGRFFDRRRHATGELLHYARTSNVLIRRDLIARWEEQPFEVAFGMSGGDDTYFFKRAYLDGATIVWADEAVVREWVPVTRVSVRWMLKREFRRGNTLSLCLRMLQDSPARRVRRVVGGLGQIARGVVTVPFGLVRGREVAVAGLKRIWFGAGLIGGLTGSVVSEYSTVHGR